MLPVVLKMFEQLDIDAMEARRRIIVIDWGIPSAEVGYKDFVSLSDLLGKGALGEEEKFTGDQVHETAMLCYSSGTTGKSKGVRVRPKSVSSTCSCTEIRRLLITILWLCSSRAPRHGVHSGPRNP